MGWRVGLARASTALLLCGAAGGADQEPVPRSGAVPVARAERGRGGAFEAVRFSLTGGKPWAAAALVVEFDLGGASAKRLTLPLVLNEDGAAERTLPDEGWGEMLGGRFVVQTGATGGPWVSDRVMASSSMTNQVFQRGDLVITEFMKDPTAVPDNMGEWLELYNTTSRPINIEGWTLSDDGSNKHTLANGKQLIVVPPGGYLVLGNNADPTTNGGVIVHHKYSGFTLANGADSIVLTARKGKLVDRVDYDDGIFWPDLPGMSISLHPASTNAYLNDDAGQWCHSTTPLFTGATDTGTPGAPNDPCP